MIIYHGSKNIIYNPIYGEGKLSNDYGRGFYCTEDSDLACEWAVKENQDGFSNEYYIDDSGLSVLNLNGDGFTIMNWLAVLISHRTFEATLPMPKEVMDYICKNFYVDVDAYDIVRGYRADDSYFSFAKDFINGTLSYRLLGQALFLGQLGEQVVIKSKKAFDRMEFSSYKKALANTWFPKRARRDRAAREQYFSMRSNVGFSGELFSIDILREEIKPDDPRL